MYFVAIFDRSGRFVITGSDDRLVKIWSMETAFCLASCRGHEVSLGFLGSYMNIQISSIGISSLFCNIILSVECTEGGHNRLGCKFE